MDIFGRYEHFPDPISLSVGALSALGGGSALAGAGVAAGAAGGIMGGFGAAQEGRNAYQMAKYNAAVKEQEAKAIEAKTGFEQTRQAEVAERAGGTMRARMGAAGVVATTGTPLLVQAKQASESELENLMIGYEGMTEAARARSEAAGMLAEGKLAKKRGKMEMWGKFMGAGGTLLSGFGSK